MAAVRESQLSYQSILVNSIDIRSYYNIGSFAATSFFGFLSFCIYLALLIVWVVLHKQKRKKQINLNNNNFSTNQPSITTTTTITAANNKTGKKSKHKKNLKKINAEQQQFSEVI